MLDRVKESLFNIVRGEIQGAKVLDLFCGSGALGIEALSRGAQRCIFVEVNEELAELACANLELCGFTHTAQVLQADVFTLPETPAPSEGLPATLVFVDPPYAAVDAPNERARLFRAIEALTRTWVAPGALVVLHHSPMPHAVWPTQALRERDKRVYGNSQLTFLEFSTGGNT